MSRLPSPSCAALVLLAMSLPAAGIGTAFTYQGTLEDAGAPANGSYDLRFTLQDAFADPVAPEQTFDDVAVVQGVFTVRMDFGIGAFDGDARFLKIAVRPGASSGAFQVLAPVTALDPAPYAQVATDALVAASVAPNAIGSTQIIDGAVGSAEIGADAVDSDAIADGAVGAAQIDASQVQRRVAFACPAGQAITGIAQDGTPTCAVPALTTYTFAVPSASANHLDVPGCALDTSGEFIESAGPAQQLPAGTYVALLPFAFSLRVRAGNGDDFPFGATANASMSLEVVGSVDSLAFIHRALNNGQDGSRIGELTESYQQPFTLATASEVQLTTIVSVNSCASAGIQPGRFLTVLRVQ